MKNIDKFKDDINTLRFGLINGIPKPCNEITSMFGGFNCRNCGFYKEPFDNNYINCEKLRLDWMIQEVQEEPEKPEIFLSKEEFNFISVAEEGFIARDSDNCLWLFVEKPFRHYDHWESEIGFCAIKNEYFKFITWNDEPILSTDLLSLGVKVKK